MDAGPNYLPLRVLTVAAIGFVLIASLAARPAPGGHGAALGVTIALAVYCAATLAALWLAPSIRTPILLAVLLLVVVAAATLISLQASNAGFLGVFPAVSAAALMLPARLSGIVAGVTIVAVAVAWTWNGRVLFVGIGLNEFGIVAVYLLSLLARRLRAGLATEFEADSCVACSVAVTGTRRDLGPDASVTLYRIAQEALTNIRKHAHPDRVEIHLAHEDSGTRLIVEDFGPACPALADDVAAREAGIGYGLTGMRERAALLGGTLAAGPTGSGFRVELWIPA